MGGDLSSCIRLELFPPSPPQELRHFPHEKWGKEYPPYVSVFSFIYALAES